MSYQYDYPRPSVTSTIAVFDIETNRILIGKRLESSEAFPGKWCLPGGFLNAKVQTKDNSSLKQAYEEYDLDKWIPEDIISKGETTEQCAIRELEEETHLKVSTFQLHLLNVYSSPNDDPRCHVVNIVYVMTIFAAMHKEISACDDIIELKWISCREFQHMNDEKLFAFNHAKIIEEAFDYYFH